MTRTPEPPAADSSSESSSDPDSRLVISRGTQADVVRLRPLWLAVHDEHQRAMPELAPYVSDEQSWAVRAALYEQLMARPGTVLLLARDADGDGDGDSDGDSDSDELVGYGLAHVLATPETWLADTWKRGARVGEIESLSVRPAYRGRGLGGRLLAELQAALHDDGVTDLILGVLAGNRAAQRLYERHGYRPTWLYLSRTESGHSA
jgi:ribosomal protein S18 acetylase RimI-like enzyme